MTRQTNLHSRRHFPIVLEPEEDKTANRRACCLRRTSAAPTPQTTAFYIRLEENEPLGKLRFGGGP